jgi:hypothetical protein
MDSGFGPSSFPAIAYTRIFGVQIRASGEVKGGLDSESAPESHCGEWVGGANCDG